MPVLSLTGARLALLASFLPGVAGSQARGSLGFGVGTVRAVRDSGRSTFSAATVSPTFEFESPSFTIGIGTTLAALPHGEWSRQGRATLWVATPAEWGAVRLGAEFVGAGVTRTGGSWSAAAHGVAEVLWAARTWGIGVGAGPSTGWIAAEPSVTALHTRARAWWGLGAATYSINVEPTRFLGAWFTDVTAGLRVTAGKATSSLWAAARVSAAYGSAGAGGAFVQAFPHPRVAIELGGGTYLREPYQGLPRAGFVAAGIRFFTTRRPVPRPASAPALPPLRPERRGDSVVVRFRMVGARSVAIAGDWDGWKPRPLQSLGGDVWEGALALRSGTYHFDLLVDGKDWVVPGGIAIVTRRGGMVGVLVVP